MLLINIFFPMSCVWIPHHNKICPHKIFMVEFGKFWDKTFFSEHLGYHIHSKHTIQAAKTFRRRSACLETFQFVFEVLIYGLTYFFESGFHMKHILMFCFWYIRDKLCHWARNFVLGSKILVIQPHHIIPKP